MRKFPDLFDWGREGTNHVDIEPTKLWNGLERIDEERNCDIFVGDEEIFGFDDDLYDFHLFLM